MRSGTNLTTNSLVEGSVGVLMKRNRVGAGGQMESLDRLVLVDESLLTSSWVGVPTHWDEELRYTFYKSFGV